MGDGESPTVADVQRLRVCCSASMKVKVCFILRDVGVLALGTSFFLLLLLNANV